MKKTDGGLEYLGFARMIAISTVMCLFNLYEYAKQKSGPLKSSLGTIENAVTIVLGPLCRKYKGVPDDALAFLDRKVSYLLNQLNFIIFLCSMSSFFNDHVFQFFTAIRKLEVEDLVHLGIFVTSIQ